MQSIKIPVSIDPYRAAAKKLDCKGIIAKGDLNRLSSMVTDIVDDARVEITFEEDLAGICVMKGTCWVSVVMDCQRCGEPFSFELVSDFKYSPDQKKLEELGLVDDFDTACLNDFGEMNLYDIIEDELILSLPLVPNHSEFECPATDLLKSLNGEELQESKTSKPFAILGELLKGKNK